MLFRSANNKFVANTADPIYGSTAISNVVDVNAGNMYPDQINPVQNATTIFYYNTTQTKVCAVKSTKGTSKVVYFGVGLEMIQALDVRNDVIKRTYDWFMEGVGIADNGKTNAARLGQNFPNPANDQTMILLSSIDRDMTIQVTDLMGRTLLNVPVKSGASQVQLSTSALQNGLYFYRLVSNGKVMDTKKMEIAK